MKNLYQIILIGIIFNLIPNMNMKAQLNCNVQEVLLNETKLITFDDNCECSGDQNCALVRVYLEDFVTGDFYSCFNFYLSGNPANVDYFDVFRPSNCQELPHIDDRLMSRYFITSNTPITGFVDLLICVGDDDTYLNTGIEIDFNPDLESCFPIDCTNDFTPPTCTIQDITLNGVSNVGTVPITFTDYVIDDCGDVTFSDGNDITNGEGVFNNENLPCGSVTAFEIGFFDESNNGIICNYTVTVVCEESDNCSPIIHCEAFDTTIIDCEFEIPNYTDQVEVFINNNSANWDGAPHTGAYGHVISIKENGTMWGWGWNGRGQLGIPGNSGRNIPTLIDCGNWIDVAIGNSHSLALKSDGTIWTTGSNTFGQLGLSGITSSGTFQQVGNDNDWEKVFCGEFQSYAIKSDGTLWAWGHNFMGNLGVGDEINKFSPTQVGNDSDWKFIVKGGGRVFGALAMKNDGSVWGWGENEPQANILFPLGAGNNSLVPIQILEAGYIDLASMLGTAYVINGSGELWGWGTNDYGQLLSAPSPSSSGFTRLGNESDWVNVEAGNYHVTLMNSSGIVFSAGRGTFGQLGNGTFTNSSSPVQIQFSDPIVDFKTTGETVYILSQSNDLYAYGANGFGLVGVGDNTNSTYAEPVQIMNEDMDLMNVTDDYTITQSISPGTIITQDEQVQIFAENASGENIESCFINIDLDCPTINSNCVTFQGADPICDESNSAYFYDFTLTNNHENQTYDHLLIRNQDDGFELDLGGKTLIPLPAPLAPGESVEMTWNILGGASEQTTFCFDVIPHNTSGEGCCSETICVELDMCCPDDATASLAMNSLDLEGQCCYSGSYFNECLPDYYTKLEIEMLEPALGLSSLTSNLGFNIAPTNGFTLEVTYGNNEFFPEGSYTDIFSYCIQGLTHESPAQQVISYRWYSMVGDIESVVDVETFTASCPLPEEPPAIDTCTVVTEAELYCDDGSYHYRFKVTNQSMGEYDASIVVIGPLGDTEPTDFSQQTFPDFPDNSPNADPYLEYGETTDFLDVELPNAQFGDSYTFFLSMHDYRNMTPEGDFWCCYDTLDVITIDVDIFCFDDPNPIIQEPLGHTIFPNPSNDNFQMRFYNDIEGEVDVLIKNMKGEILNVPSNLTADNMYNINIKDLHPGLYFVVIKDDYGNMSHSKFIKK